MLQNVYQEQNVSCFSGLCSGGTAAIGQKRCQTVFADIFLRPRAANHNSCSQAWIWNIKNLHKKIGVYISYLPFYQWWFFCSTLKFGSHRIDDLWGYRWHGFWVYCRGCCEQTDDDDVWEEGGTLSYDPSRDSDKPQGQTGPNLIFLPKNEGWIFTFFFPTDKDGFCPILFEKRSIRVGYWKGY